MNFNENALCIFGALRTLPELAHRTHSFVVKPYSADVFLALQLGQGKEDLRRLRTVVDELKPKRTVGYHDDEESVEWCRPPSCSLESSPVVVAGHPRQKMYCGARLKPSPTFFLMSVKRARCMQHVKEIEENRANTYARVIFMRSDLWFEIPRTRGDLTSVSGILVDSCGEIPAPNQQKCIALTRTTASEPYCEIANDWFAVTTRKWADVYAAAAQLLVQFSQNCSFSHICACHREPNDYQLTELCLLTIWLRLHKVPFSQLRSIGRFAYVVDAVREVFIVDSAKVFSPVTVNRSSGMVWRGQLDHLLSCALHGRSRNETPFTTNPTVRFSKDMHIATAKLVHKQQLHSWFECPRE